MSALYATSQTILGIVVDVVADDKGHNALVQVLWDSAGKNETVKRINLKKAWPGCVISLDGMS